MFNFWLFCACCSFRTSKYYFTVKDHQLVAIHPSSILSNVKPVWVIYQEFVLTNKNYVRTVSKVDPKLLLEVAPFYYDLEDMKAGNIKRDLEKIKAVMEESSEEEN